MRRATVGLVLAIFVGAVFLAVFIHTAQPSGTQSSLTTSSAPSTETSASSSAFTYRTVSSSSTFSTSFGNGATTVFNIVSTTSFNTTWTPGQPIPVVMVETGNLSVAGSAFAVDLNNDRLYVLGTSSLTVLDASSHAVIASIPFPASNTGGSVNAGLAVDASTDMIYASVQGRSSR